MYQPAPSSVPFFAGNRDGNRRKNKGKSPFRFPSSLLFLTVPRNRLALMDKGFQEYLLTVPHYTHTTALFTVFSPFCQSVRDPTGTGNRGDG